MSLKIPQNQVVESKYTIGKEYMFVSTQNEYQGYYYELNGKTFAGKEFNTDNPEIIKIQSIDFNKLLGNAATYAYGKISGTKIYTDVINSFPLSITTNLLDKEGEYFLQFFSKKSNLNTIKSIDEETYISIKKNPL